MLCEAIDSIVIYYLWQNDETMIILVRLDRRHAHNYLVKTIGRWPVLGATTEGYKGKPVLKDDVHVVV